MRQPMSNTESFDVTDMLRTCERTTDRLRGEISISDYELTQQEKAAIQELFAWSKQSKEDYYLF